MERIYIFELDNVNAKNISPEYLFCQLLIRIVTLRKPGLKVGLRKQKIFSELLLSVVFQPAKQTLEILPN